MELNNLQIACTLCPRDNPTINKSIKSLRDVWFTNTIYIYAEPWEYNIEDQNIIITIHDQNKWCFRNFDYVMNQNKENKYLFIFQDDYIFRQWIKEEIEKIISEWKDFTFYNFILDWRSATYIFQDGWNDTNIWRWLIWACFLFKDPKIILNHEFYINHLTRYVPRRNQQIDACIWEIWRQIDIPCYLPSKSFVAHIWESTIGHSDDKLWIFFEKTYE